MKPSYRKEKDNDYMILEAPGKPEGGEYQIRMLLVNPIYGLLPCKMRMVDGSRAFYYDITEKQPMTSVFERRLMGKEDIEKLLGGLEKAMDEAGRYLLVMEQFILKPEYIFQDTETGEFFFCYLPFYDGSLETDFRELAEYILKRLDHSQEEAVLWGYDIYSRSAEEHFSIGKILESVHERAAKEAVRKSREKSPEKMRQTAPREERQKPVEELEYIEVEEGVSEETARPAAGRAESRPVEKTILREGKAENTEKTVEREKPEKRNTEARREAWAAEKKKKHLFGKKQDKNIENRPKKSKGRKSVEFRAEFRGRRKQFLQVFIGMTASVAAAVWAVVCQGLNFIQAGGILFLCMGLLVYFTTVFQKKPAKKATSPEEEVLLWETGAKGRWRQDGLPWQSGAGKISGSCEYGSRKAGKYRSRPGTDDRGKTERAGRHFSSGSFGEQNPCFSGKKRRRLVSQGQRFHKRDFSGRPAAGRRRKEKAPGRSGDQFFRAAFLFSFRQHRKYRSKLKCLEMKEWMNCGIF